MIGAGSVAANADAVSEAAGNALVTATKLQQTSEQAGNTSERGQIAVDEAGHAGPVAGRCDAAAALSLSTGCADAEHERRDHGEPVTK